MTDIASPFDDLRGLIDQLPMPDSCAIKKIRPGMEEKALSGALPDYLYWLGEWQGKPEPTLKEAHICLLASSYTDGSPPEDITTYIEQASKGRAPVNFLCVQRGIGLRVLELAPTLPFAVNPNEPAWSEPDCMAAIAFGMESAAAGGDLLGLSDLAFGNEVYAVSLICSVLNCSPEALGVLDSDLLSDIKALMSDDGALDGKDSLIKLHAYAGREIAAIVGGIISARSRRIPVVLDGIGALAAATVLWALDPVSIAHCKFAAPPMEGMAEKMIGMGLKPMLSDAIGAGPGCAVAAAIGILGHAVDLQSVPLPQS